jgi:hypothetical protein
LKLYEIVAQYFSTAVEERQVSDRSYRASQTLPFIVEDIHGSIIVPENLGYINFETGHTIEKILQNANSYLTVRDTIVGAFYHPYFEPKYIQLLVEGLKKMGFKPFDLREMPGVVRGENIAIFSGVSTKPYPLLKPARKDVASSEEPRLLKILLNHQWLHTFELNYRYQKLASRWSKKPMNGPAVVQIPRKHQRIFIAQKMNSRPSAAQQIKEVFEGFIRGKTNNPIQTALQWLIWVLLLGALGSLIVLGKVLLRFRKKHENPPRSI